MSLTSATKRLQPVTRNLGPEGAERGDVGWHGVVREIPRRYLAEPAPLLGQGLMPALREGDLDRPESRPHPGSRRMPYQEKLSRPGLSADVRKTEEVECLRGPLQSLLLPPLGREELKGDEPSLVGMQFQREAT